MNAKINQGGCSTKPVFSPGAKPYAAQILACAAFILLILISWNCRSQAFSCNCLMDQKISSGTFNKLGTEQTICDGDIGPYKYYLTSTDKTEWDYLYVEPYSTWSKTTHISDNESSTCDLSTVTNIPGYGWSCSVITVDAGSASYSDSLGEDYNESWLNGVYTGDTDIDYYTDFSWWDQDPVILPDLVTNIVSACNPVSSDFVLLLYGADDGETGSIDYKTSLTSEFDDQAMFGQLRKHMTPYPDGPDTWTTGTGCSASFSLDTNDFAVSGSKLKYRLKVPAPSEPKASYLCTWTEVTTTTTPSGTTSVSVDMSETITGTGDPAIPAYGSEHEVQMPTGGPGTTITIQEQSPSVQKIQSPGDSGTGGPSAS